MILRHTHASVFDLLEVHGDGTTVDVLMLGAAMNENADLLGANLVGTVTKHKQHGINDVGFPTAIWADNSRKTLEGRIR